MWRDVYPIGIHFAAAQLLGGIFINILAYLYADYQEVYYHWAMELSGIVGITAMLFMLYFYRKDKAAREYGRLIPKPSGCPLRLKDGLWFLAIGAGLAVYVNIVVNMFSIFVSPDTYVEEMNLMTQGKSFLQTILWIGIVSPLAEEVIFRWGIYLRLRDSMGVAATALISGGMFGIYHGNLLQGIYAGVMGACFAYFLEMSGSLWSCVLMHIGANCLSLLISAYGIRLNAYMGGLLLVLYTLLLLAVVGGFVHFSKKGRRRGYRAI